MTAESSPGNRDRFQTIRNLAKWLLQRGEAWGEAYGRSAPEVTGISYGSSLPMTRHDKDQRDVLYNVDGQDVMELVLKAPYSVDAIKHAGH